jgi:HSP20 family molecular chaperone IbpA
MASDETGLPTKPGFRRNRCHSLQLEEVAMSRMSVFNSPLLLGFEQIERVLDRAAKTSSDGYPPYNIEQRGDNALRITLAVAGFSETDLSITVEDNQLVIRGRQEEEDAPQRLFLHRGIAARQFQRSFVLAEGIEVVAADLNNGLLRIDLQRPVPPPQVRRIAIRTREGEESPGRDGNLPVGTRK